MLQFSSPIAAEIAAGTARGFITILIKSGVGATLLATTTHYAAVTLSDGITYLADDNIISIDPPQLSSTVDREEYKIVVDGAAMDADLDLVGCSLEVRLCFVNTATGLPYTTLADTLLFYKGKVSGKSAEFETESAGSYQFTVKGASPMMALDMIGGMYLSRDSIRSMSPEDSCCDEIYQGSSALVLKWGRL